MAEILKTINGQIVTDIGSTKVTTTDGLIVRNLRTKDKRIPFLKKHNVNFVAWGRTKNLKNYSWVDLDNNQSMKIIMEHLFKKNHKNIAFVNKRLSSFLKNNLSLYEAISYMEKEEEIEFILQARKRLHRFKKEKKLLKLTIQ